jgi:RHS repeat-associated protein
MAQRPVRGVVERVYDSAGAPSVPYTLDIKENVLYATRVEDRFGNYVDYTYVNTPTQPGKLTKIQSSDGRLLDLEYGTNGKLWKVKAGSTASPAQRTWTYTYGVDASPSQRPTLNSIALPDGSAWTIQFAQFGYAAIFYGLASSDPQEPSRTCTMLPEPRNGTLPAGNPAPVTIVGSVTHPAGATATYTLDIREFFRSEVAVVCNNFNLTSGGAIGVQEDDTPLYPLNWHDWSLTSKTLQGPGLPLQNWTYAYDADAPTYHFLGPWNSNYGNLPTCPAGTDCSLPRCASASCADRSYTLVTAPDQTKERFSFGNTWQYDEGKLLKVQRGYNPATQTAMETIDHTYDLYQSANQTYPKRFGTSQRSRADGFTAEYHRPKTSTVTSRDGATFTWSATSFEALARPTGVTKSSSLGHSKTESYAYAMNTAKWVLQPQSTYVNGVETARAVFDPTWATMTNFYAFDQLQQTLAYDTTSSVASGLLGTVTGVTDGNSQATYLSNWYRGVPRTITYPGSISESAVVNDFGWITSTTDELGYATSYGHDGMGRINSVTPPTGDVVAWSPTSIVYAPVASSEFGIPASHWRRTETTGSSVKETYYDGLWRPILDRQRTTDSSAGERFVRKTFDHAGRETFASYPTSSVTNNDYTMLNTGIDTAYDALGRVTGTTADSELGLLSTSTAYLAPFQTQHTNARSQVTATTYQAFDEPSYDAPLQITAPESTTSTYTRDAYGKPITLTRSGTWFNPTSGTNEFVSAQRTFVYDGYQRLCKTIEPDAGITVFDYDAAGNRFWKAAGQNTLTSTIDCQRTSVPTTDRSIHAYDGRNRLLGIDHPAGTDDVGYTYFNDGAMQTATVGTLSTLNPVAWSTTRNAWTYTYNQRRGLESESLAIDGKTFLLDWSYAANGAVSNLTYPGGHAVSFNPNAYGEPRQVGVYASSATYQPSGQLAGFTYGNSTTRTITPNTRQLPGQILDSRFGVKLLDHLLTYDANANLGGITDGVPGGLESRTLGYDGRDRLTSVTGAATGNETYTYDPLDRTRRTVLNGVDRRFHVNATTQRLSQITTVGSADVVDYLWNDRGELSSRNTSRPGNPTFTSPTIWRNGFEENTITTLEPMTFDRAGRLIAYNGSFTHQYDAHGRRVASVVPMWGTRYQVYDRQGELRYVEDVGRAERIEFFSLNGTLVAQRSRPLSSETATISYLHSDHRGTPSVKSATGGTVDYRSRLKPYGAPYDGIWRDGPGFTKHAMDEIGELVYMQQRYYDPAGGVFFSPDPVGRTAGDFNPYQYARSNPYSYVDPDGREAGCITLGTSCGFGSVSPAEFNSRVSTVADFTPILGDIKGIVEAIQNPTAVNIAAAVVGLVPVAGDLAGKTIKQGGNILENAAKGRAGEAATRAKLGDDIAGEQVTFRTSDGTRTRADFVTKQGEVVETKTGNAQLSSGQAKLQNDINAGRQVTPVGRNAAGAGLPPGQATTMKSCTVDRPEC